MKHIERRRLIVEESVKGDVYKDIVRIHWRERGKRNKIGAIVAISVDGGPRRFFSLRGLPEEDAGKIRFDHVTRDELHLKTGEQHDFAIRETSAWEKVRWAVSATDPAARIAAWVAVWSGVVGIVCFILGVVGVIPVIKDWLTPQKTEHRTAIYSPAQDRVKTSPQYYNVLLENNQVRVLEYRLKPGEKEPVHSHPAGVIYVLSASTLKFSYPNGRTEEKTAAEGETIWREPVTHGVENIGKTEAHAIAIDLKE